jgi:hypothetical protein
MNAVRVYRLVSLYFPFKDKETYRYSSMTNLDTKDYFELAKFRAREYLGFASSYGRHQHTIGCDNVIVRALSGKRFANNCKQWFAKELEVRDIARRYQRACTSGDQDECERNVKELDRVFIYGQTKDE